MAQYAYNPFTGNLDRISDGSGSGITKVTATNAGSSVMFDLLGTVENLEVTDSLFNTIVGENAGNGTLTGTENSGFGNNVLLSLTSGVFNSAFGSRCMQNMQNGISNTAMGLACLFANISGQDNAGFGDQCLTNNLSNFNTSMGSKSMNGTGSGGGQLNSCFGYASGNKFSTTSNSTFVGALSGGNISGGTLNDGFGYNTLFQLLTGSYNICLGAGSGDLLTSNESSNLYLNNSGVAGESNTIRIGRQGSGNQQQNRTFISGVAGVSVSNNEMVTIDTTTGQLGSVSSSKMSPNAFFTIVEDFLYNSVSSLWNVSGFSQNVGIASADHPGVFATSAQSNGFRYIFFGQGSSLAGQMYLGGGEIEYNWVFSIATLSDVTNGYILSLGLGDFGTVALAANGVYFSYSDTINSGNWTLNCIDATTATSTDSGVAVTTGWHKASCVINALGTSAEFFIDEVSIGTVATNLPTANPIRPEIIVQWLAGTNAASNVMVDMFYMNQTLTNPR